MLSSFVKRPIYPFNKTISEYCKNSINESIRKLTEKNNVKIVVDIDDDSDKPEMNLYGFLLFLSISTITFYLYRRLE